MSRRKIAKRSRVKPFVKAVNYKHLMPTRYSFDIKINDVLGEDAIKASNSYQNIGNCRLALGDLEGAFNFLKKAKLCSEPCIG